MNNYTKNENFMDIINSFKTNSNVDCIALGGSRSTGCNDEMSDFDIYVYCNKILDKEERTAILKDFCSETEICNHYWESEDNCIMNNGISIDIIYRNIDMMKKYLNFVVDNGNAFNGYTTCFWHNIVTCQVIFDNSKTFTKIKNQYTIPYPETLRKNIIKNNRNLLNGKLPSYDMQIKKVKERNDLVSVHHRITEFLSSYFDIIFAYNKQLHPGEKRLVELCKKQCKILPNNFEQNIQKLLSSVTTGNPYLIVKDMIAELDKILKDC